MERNDGATTFVAVALGSFGNAAARYNGTFAQGWWCAQSTYLHRT